MENKNQDSEFIEQCRRIDFSAQSLNREKNLETLKNKLSDINDEKENIMNKKIRKPVAFAAVSAALLCFTITVYGQDLVQIIKTVTLGNHAKYQVTDDSRTTGPVPKELIGQIFDEDGNALTECKKGQVLYNAKGQEVIIYNDGNKDILITLEAKQSMEEGQAVTFSDMKEGQSYFICDTLMPAYLPDGYTFNHIGFYSDPRDKANAEVDANKYMSLHFTKDKEEIYAQIRYMDEETAFESTAGKNVQKVKINGYDAIVDDNEVSVQIGDVIYMFFGNKNIDNKELVKIVESLK